MACRLDSEDLRRFTRLHFVLESDLLSELDDIPSTPVALLQSAAICSHENGQSNRSSDSDHYSNIENDVARLFFHHFHLRLVMNDILHELYTPSKAYTPPSVIGEAISKISRNLEDWYRSLPLNMQFSRSTVTIHSTKPQSRHLVRSAICMSRIQLTFCLASALPTILRLPISTQSPCFLFHPPRGHGTVCLST